MTTKRKWRVGDTNTHGNTFLRATEYTSASRKDGMKIDVLKCKDCGASFGSNSCDTWDRRSPCCQDGKPGERIRVE